MINKNIFSLLIYQMLVSKKLLKESFLHISYSIDIIVYAFNLFLICVDLSRFLMRGNFKNHYSTLQLVKAIVKYNLNAIYTFGKASIRFVRKEFCFSIILFNT